MTDRKPKAAAAMTIPVLNAAVAREVMGWRWFEGTSTTQPGIGKLPAARPGWVKTSPIDGLESYVQGDWSPADAIGDAFDVVERMRERRWRFTMGDEGGEPFARFHRGTHIGRSDTTWPRCICEAALAAVRSEA